MKGFMMFCVTLLLSALVMLVYTAERMDIPVLAPRELPAAAKGPYTVQEVIDGDTVVLKRDNALAQDGEEITVRLIGMDTPETVDPRKPVECFGPEASAAATELLSKDKSVFLETDPDQGETDRYGRTLGYLWTGTSLDGKQATLFNQQMISDGYAREYTFDGAYKYQDEFRAAEKTAQDNRAGLWSPDTCNGKTD